MNNIIILSSRRGENERRESHFETRSGKTQREAWTIPPRAGRNGARQSVSHTLRTQSNDKRQ